MLFYTNLKLLKLNSYEWKGDRGQSVNLYRPFLFVGVVFFIHAHLP